MSELKRTYADAAVQTISSASQSEELTLQGKLFENDTSYCPFATVAPTRLGLGKRRHTIHAASVIDHVSILDIHRSNNAQDKSQTDVCLSFLSPQSANSSTSQTFARTPGPQTRASKILPLLSPTSSPAFSDSSESVEIIDHRSSLDSPDRFRSSIPDNQRASNLSPATFYSDDDIKVDDEGWIKWRGCTSPQPIPALHGPLSLPYARCPSGAEGTVMSSTIAPFGVVWGLEAGEEEEEEVPRKPKAARSDVSDTGLLHNYASYRSDPYRPGVAIKREASSRVEKGLRPAHPDFVTSTPSNHKPAVPKVAIRSPRQTSLEVNPYLSSAYISPITPTTELLSNLSLSSQHRSIPRLTRRSYVASPNNNLIGSPFAPRRMAAPFVSPEVPPGLLSSVLAMTGNGLVPQQSYLPTPPNSTSPLWAPAFSPGPARITNPSNSFGTSPEVLLGSNRSISSVLDGANRYMTPRLNLSPELRRGDVVLSHLRRSSALAVDAAINRVPLTPPISQSPRPIKVANNATQSLRKANSMEFRYIGQSPNIAGLRHSRSLQLRHPTARDLTPVPEEEGNDKDEREHIGPVSVLLQAQIADGNKSPPMVKRPRVRVKLPTKSSLGVINAQ